MERDLAKFAMGTLVVIALFDVATHAEGSALLVTSFGKAWANILAVLSGQRPVA